MMVHHAASGQTVTIDGVGGWPAALDVDAYIERHGGEIPLGVRRTVVPAAPSACLTALERWGTMRFPDSQREQLVMRAKVLQGTQSWSITLLSTPITIDTFRKMFPSG
ncbi:MAG: hypothetical protein Ct9H300mP16_10290 [Pseudomonadota bacterium]|nr:MAG: hypothetical protein Ct9H300mP16_10290 [Pseudomonadota bacterium]